MSVTEPWALYADTRSRFIEMVGSVDSETAGRRVPLCPDWTVTDVAAHVCGINSDILSGRLEGLGSDAWTAHQVEERAGRGADEICDEWLGYADEIRQVMTDDPFMGVRLTGDLIVHTHDVQHALGLPIDRGDEATITAAERYVPQLQERVLDVLGIAIDVDLTDGKRFAATADQTGPALSLRASSYDFLRSITGRRSRRQVESLDWTGDPTAVIEKAWTSYGSLRQDDVDD